MKIKYGSTRTVILTKNYAFKIPMCLTSRKTMFPYRGYWFRLLQGLLSNMQEKEFSGHFICDINYRCATVIFYLWGGFLVVMKKGKDIYFEEYEKILTETKHIDYNKTLVESKLDSFKKIDNEIQIVDFGS